MDARIPGEHIREWEEHSGWDSSPYPLYRVYAETFEDSRASKLLGGSKNYKEISGFDVYIFALAFILFSVIIVSYVLLMVYYTTLIFHSLRVEK